MTDYTVADASCVLSDVTEAKHEVVFSAPRAGDWTIYVYQDNGASDPFLAYEMTAYVRHYTKTVLAVPRGVKSNGSVSYAGRVSGASAGTVKLQSRSFKRPVWKTFARAKIGATGSFKYDTKVAEPGTYRIKAVYAGDGSHLPSSALVSFKVD